MAKRTMIADMKPNQWLEGHFALQNCQLGQTKGNKPYLKCILADRSARTPGRMWNVSEDLVSGLPTDGFVWIEGQTQPYQGQLQIIIQSIEPVEPHEVNLLDLLPSTEHDIDKMFQEVLAITQTIQNAPLKALVQAYLDDASLMEQFKQAPAAEMVHHAYLGGLLEHTLSMLRLGQHFCAVYPQLNRDIVLTGVFLHDLAKCDELQWHKGFTYTDRGRLIGHIAQGLVWLEQKAAQLAEQGTPIPTAVLNVLGHIILSHHGRPEFGAAKVPATPEAIAVSMIDNVDAKMQLTLGAARGGPGAAAQEGAQLNGQFTEKIWALDTRLYRPDPTTIPEPEPV